MVKGLSCGLTIKELSIINICCFIRNNMSESCSEPISIEKLKLELKVVQEVSSK